MGEDDDRRAGGAPLQVLFEPFELLGAETASLGRLERQHIDQPDKMHPALVEAVPAAGLLLGGKPLEELLAVVADHVVLAGDVMDVLLDRLQDLGGGIELGRLREMRDVAGVEHHCRLFRQFGDAVERRLQGGVRIGVGLLVEADMAVADLDEGEPVHWRPEGLAKAEAARHAAGHGPDDAGAGPGHAFEEPAPAGAEFVGLLRIHDVRSFA